MYLSALCSFLGLHVATSGQLVSRSSPAWVAVIVLLLRMVSWARRPKENIPVQRIERELRTTVVFAALVSVFFIAWGLYLFSGSSNDKSFILLFGSIPRSDALMD